VQRLMTISGLPDAAARMQALMAGLPSLDEQVQQTIDARRLAFREGRPGAARGAELFRKHCAVCHRLENQGERIGPELDGVGRRGLGRLLEDLLDPSRNVDRNYRATVIVTNKGQVLTGLALREEGRVVMLADQTGKTHQVPLSQIDERRVLDVSAMPANVDEILLSADFADLLAFLLTKSVKPAAPDPFP
jgi:putative heme-binding domain-containing protein